ncbi:M23 family metallopeptidase [Flavobacterium wongokense]|uniref:M23 family metallopeptidase n=1 Tax=Flavobacterium wongokense TaxID=2910674 RepID=UPI001F3575CD|nr:M23 family metallopeptidase [Flavobacterium sp. WG47]MCF6133139.1 M23 family metallopeptidase [Flavobacterium sp. WG47]
MKSLITAVLLVFSIGCFAQLKTKLYNEKTPEGYNVLVDNDEFCPISMKIDLELTNMSSSNGNHKIFVIPAKTKGFIITKLQAIRPNGGGGFKTQSAANYGDATATPTEFIYSLPFQKGKSFAVHQGYNGSFSHQGENALDFTMPIGTEVVAARDGVVVKVVENNNQACPERSCTQFNNYILLYHNDGTFSNYVHLKQNGAVVQEGDVVKQDELIGYSGFTGFANGPHLHFMVFVQRIDKQETLRTRFKVDDGKQSEFLNERVDYSKNY